jgi:UDP-glucuronate decarboxylase
MINAFLALMGSGDDVTGPINVGNPGEFTMLELAQNVIDITGSKSKIERRPLPQDDPKQRRPNIEKAQQILGWTPKVQLKEGLTRTIEYFDKLIASKKAV